MHILVLTPGFPQNEKDSSCHPAMQDYFKALLIEHPAIKLSIISIHYPFKKTPHIWQGIKVYNCGGKSRKYPLKFFYLLRAISYSLKINKELNVNIIHSFWLSDTALLGSILGKFFKIKNICTLMGQDAMKGNIYFKILSLNNIIKVTLSEYQSKYYINSTGNKPNYIIPWGMNNIEITKNNRPFDIIGVGSLISNKNYKLFIKIISKLKIEYPLINCLLIGDGKQKSELLEIIKMEKLCNNITLMGQLPREKVLSKMMESKVLLHTSNYESFGLVILEGLVSGCYIVSKNVGIAKKNKKILIFKNIDDALHLIKEIITNPHEFNPENPYPIKDTVSSYMQLYKKYSVYKG